MNYFVVSKLRDGEPVYWLWKYEMWSRLFSPACLTPLREAADELAAANSDESTIQIDKYKIIHQGRI